MRIAVDAMGGDDAPEAIVEGAIEAAKRLDLPITLVGAEATLVAALARHGDWRSLGIGIADAPEVVGMADAPATGFSSSGRD